MMLMVMMMTTHLPDCTVCLDQSTRRDNDEEENYDDDGDDEPPTTSYQGVAYNNMVFFGPKGVIVQCGLLCGS